MFKNSKFYIISYLNALIHGLLSAIDNYAAYFLHSYSQYNYEKI